MVSAKGVNRSSWGTITIRNTREFPGISAARTVPRTGKRARTANENRRRNVMESSLRKAAWRERCLQANARAWGRGEGTDFCRSAGQRVDEHVHGQGTARVGAERGARLLRGLREGQGPGAERA